MYEVIYLLLRFSPEAQGSVQPISGWGMPYERLQGVSRTVHQIMPE
jgi:hypothetical protein